jgi:hypothetical protein
VRLFHEAFLLDTGLEAFCPSFWLIDRRLLPHTLLRIQALGCFMRTAAGYKLYEIADMTAKNARGV